MEAPEASRCRGAFWMALLFDAAGLALLLLGALVDVFFSDLLIYSGGVGLLFSLLWWVFWYVGNLEVPPDELQDDVEAEDPGQVGRVRSIVRSLSRHLPGSFGPCSRRSVPGRSRRWLDKKAEVDSPAAGGTPTGSPKPQKRQKT